MIRPSEISKLAHQLGLGDKTIEKDYVLTWVLLAMADSPLCEMLAFKGGTAIKKMYIPDYRFSEDLDFTLLDASHTNDDLQAAVEALYPWLKREANLTLATRKIEVHSSGNLALYLNYVGPLQGDLASRFIKVISAVMKCWNFHLAANYCEPTTAIARGASPGWWYILWKKSWQKSYVRS
jgi:hypothetical protein